MRSFSRCSQAQALTSGAPPGRSSRERLDHRVGESELIIFAQRLEKVNWRLSDGRTFVLCFGHGAVPEVFILIVRGESFDIDRG